MNSLTVGDLLDSQGLRVVDPTDGATGVVDTYVSPGDPYMSGPCVNWDGHGKPDPELHDHIAQTTWALGYHYGENLDEPTGLYPLEPILKRTARACLFDHAPRDPLTRKANSLNDVVMRDALLRDGYITSDEAFRKYLVENHIDERRYRPDEQRRRPVPDIVGDAEVLGNAYVLSRRHGSPTAVVVRVRYAETWGADYEVEPNLETWPMCWQD